MAPKLNESLVNGDRGYISDDSSFYGDANSKTELEEQAAAFDPATYWATHDRQLSVIAHKNNAKASVARPPPKWFHNMYEDYPSGRHLSETVSAFLARLPPHSTPIATYGPWIYIANPEYQDRPTSEDLGGFKQVGHLLLGEFSNRKAGVEASMAGKAKGMITKKVTPLRKELEINLFKAAKEKGIKSGKWMLFPSAENIDSIWSLVANAVAEGELGHAAKVGTDDGSGDRGARLICVYTEDFEDHDDVKRVLEKMVTLGLVKSKGLIGQERGIYYKADAFTHLDIMSGNQWGLKPTMYSSKDMLAKGKK